MAADRMFFSVITILGLLTVGNWAQDEDCNSAVIPACQEQLKPLLGKKNFVFGNQTELMKYCGEINLALMCVDDFLNRCLNADRRDIDDFFSGFRSFLRDICEEKSDVSEEFLRHGQCMSAAEDKVQVCMNRTHRHHQGASRSDPVAAPNGTSAEDVVDSLCCAVKQILMCSEVVYSQECGEEAAKMGRQSLLTMFGPTVKQVCIEDGGQFRCSGSTTRSPSSAILVTLVAMFVCLLQSGHRRHLC